MEALSPYRLNTPPRAPSRTTRRETEAGAHEQAARQSERPLWLQPSGWHEFWPMILSLAL